VIHGVPEPEFYLVGGYLKEGTTRHDIDIVGVFNDHAFEILFGYTHKTLMADYKKTPHPEKLEKYKTSCRVMSWALTSMFGKYVDFKWGVASMLIGEPKVNLHLKADLTMYL